MQAAVAVRRPLRNCATTAVSAPFVTIASRIVTADRLEIAVRGEFEGTLAEAQRHANRLASAVADRFGASACAEVHTFDGLPVYFVEARR